jgi:hypothetical protein
MKLLSEATVDTQFTALMDKIQQAIIKLEGFVGEDFVPLNSQVLMVEVAGEDLSKLAKKLKAQRG